MSRETPKLGHEPIAMRLVMNGGQFEKAGDFRWGMDREGRRSLLVAVPARGYETEGRWLAASFTIDHPNQCGSSWSWDGNETKPTLSPSLHWIGIWHGWVQAGRLIEA